MEKKTTNFKFHQKNKNKMSVIYTKFDPLCRGTFSLLLLARPINARTVNGFRIPLATSNLELLVCKILAFFFYCKHFANFQ